MSPTVHIEKHQGSGLAAEFTVRGGLWRHSQQPARNHKNVPGRKAPFVKAQNKVNKTEGGKKAK